MRDTAANSKNSKWGATRSEPKKGTKRWKIYNVLYKKRGRAVSLSTIRKAYGSTTSKYPGLADTVMHTLQNEYLLDIRCVGRKKWSLCGRWVGKAYIDYVVNPECP